LYIPRRREPPQPRLSDVIHTGDLAGDRHLGVVGDGNLTMEKPGENHGELVIYIEHDHRNSGLMWIFSLNIVTFHSFL
jgi:hypothetical protein